MTREGIKQTANNLKKTLQSRLNDSLDAAKAQLVQSRRKNAFLGF